MSDHSSIFNVLIIYNYAKTALRRYLRAVLMSVFISCLIENLEFTYVLDTTNTEIFDHLTLHHNLLAVDSRIVVDDKRGTNITRILQTYRD